MTLERIEQLLAGFSRVSLAVVGDFFLDKYLIIDRRLSEVSLETGKEAYQVVDIRHSPGAAGTVCNNLAALEVGTLYALGLVGDDGEGYELRQGLTARGVRLDYLHPADNFFTPTYTKPMERLADGSEEEMNRLDLKNRQPLPAQAEDEIISCLREVAAQVDGILVADQVQERNCGVITDRVREELQILSAAHPGLIVVADSRVRIGEFHGVILKPNQQEAVAALTGQHPKTVSLDHAQAAAQELSRRTGQPVFLTLGPKGIMVCTEQQATTVPGVPLEGPLDIVGAGDSAFAGLTLSLSAKAKPVEAAAIGNLVASITVQQLGTTGTASREQVTARFEEVAELYQGVDV